MMSKKVILFILCSFMILSLNSCKQDKEISLSKTKNENIKQDNKSKMPTKNLTNLSKNAKAADNKEEMVYVTANYDGSIKEIEVNCKLSGFKNDNLIADKSELIDIKNYNSDEEYYKLDNENIFWENHKKSINYKGSSNKKLPVNLKLSYFLNDKKIEPKEIIGKTGKIKIRFDYENNTDVPFIFITIVPLSEDVFSNISVKNGNLSSFGNTDMAYGFIVPKLYEKLKLNKFDITKDIKMHNYMEINAYAKDFKLDFTATIISSGLFKDIKDKELNKLIKKADNMRKFKNSGQKLYDGSHKLWNGLSDFGNYFYKYICGVEALKNGFNKLKETSKYLDNNIDSLSNGSNTLYLSLSDLDENLSKIDLSKLNKDEIERLGYISQSIKKLKSGAKNLNNGIKKYSIGIKGLNNGNTKIQSAIENFEKSGKQLKDGFDKVKDGSKKLSDGINKLNKKGFNKISKTGIELNELLENIKFIKTNDTKYTNFSGITKGTKGSVSFIIETKEMSK